MPPDAGSALTHTAHRLFMAPRLAPQHAAPAYRAAVVLCLLSGPIHGFVVGPARTGSPAANHAPHTHHGGSAAGAKTEGRRSRMRCNAVAASPVAEELAPEEVWYFCVYVV